VSVAFKERGLDARALLPRERGEGATDRLAHCSGQRQEFWRRAAGRLGAAFGVGQERGGRIGGPARAQAIGKQRSGGFFPGDALEVGIEVLRVEVLGVTSQLDLRVPDAALAALRPAGWTLNVATQGSAKDANLRAVCIDRLTINGPGGTPVGKGSNRLVYLVAPVTWGPLR